jgi:hypothetical protein
MDNYEWLESCRPEAKFGLFYVDHSSIQTYFINKVLTITEIPA